MTQPAPFQRYLDLTPEADPSMALRDQLEQIFPLLLPLSEEETSIVHPPYAWTIKEVVGHMSDTERVFSYRALRFARGDQTPLPGFDQDAYMTEANFNDRTYAELAQELTLVRQATLALFHTLPEGTLDRRGIASEFAWTVRDLGRCLVGHVRHHWQIIQSRLGK